METGCGSHRVALMIRDSAGMEIADIDESGTIDKKEFAVFVKKLDKSVDDDKCNEIFEA